MNEPDTAKISVPSVHGKLASSSLSTISSHEDSVRYMSLLHEGRHCNDGACYMVVHLPGNGGV